MLPRFGGPDKSAQLPFTKDIPGPTSPPNCAARHPRYGVAPVPVCVAGVRETVQRLTSGKGHIMKRLMIPNGPDLNLSEVRAPDINGTTRGR
jgi:hypothetical protein